MTSPRPSLAPPWGRPSTASSRWPDRSSSSSTCSIRRFLDASEDPRVVLSRSLCTLLRGRGRRRARSSRGAARPSARSDSTTGSASPPLPHPPRRPWHSASTAHSRSGRDRAHHQTKGEGQTMNTVSVQAGALDDRRARARSSRVAIALAVSALLLLSMLPATAAAKPALAADRPTIVLVHGSWAGPSGWDQVAAGLHKDGFATEARRPLTSPRSPAMSRRFARRSTRSPARRSSSAIRTAGWSSRARPPAGPTCSASSTPPGSCRSRMRRRSACWRHTPRPRRSSTSSPIPSRSCTSTPRSSLGCSART